jgi:hypothetical protein
MDEAVDQVMGRSQDEKGAEKAVAIRRGQQKERARLQSEITAEQKTISQLSEERAPIAAEVRKVEAEVGPIKYIAKFIYGERGADENMLEQAVTWIIILIVVVFDPLAVIMLLAAQMTFGWRNESSDEGKLIQDSDGTIIGIVPPATTTEEIKQTHTEEIPSETPSTALGGDITAPEEPTVEPVESELDKWNKMIEEAEREVARAEETTVEERLATGQSYIDSEGTEQVAEPTKPEPDFPEDESKKKTYMIKDETGQIQTKVRE